MRIFKYQQWLEESEEVAPAPAAEPVPTTDTLPEAPMEEPISDIPGEAPVPEEPVAGDMPAEGESSEYDQLDIARKDAIRAFKAKYEEFTTAAEDQKEGMKEELKTLFDAMNTAVEAFDSLVAKEIGADAAPEIDDEP
jgi:hypothetical protein